MLCVFLACHNLCVWVGILNLIASIPVLSFLLVLIFDYPFFSAHQEPGIKAHMLNRVSCDLSY